MTATIRAALTPVPVLVYYMLLAFFVATNAGSDIVGNFKSGSIAQIAVLAIGFGLKTTKLRDRVDGRLPSILAVILSMWLMARQMDGQSIAIFGAVSGLATVGVGVHADRVGAVTLLGAVAIATVVWTLF